MSETHTYPVSRRREKLKQLAELEGYDNPMDMLQASMEDSVIPGICMNMNCDYTTEVEPDQDRGHCESCGSPTVQSALILAGLI